MSQSLEARFSGLIRKRERAIGVFRKAHEGLLKTQEKIASAITICQEKIEDYQGKVNEEQDAIHFLEVEKGRTKTTADKIKSVIE